MFKKILSLMLVANGIMYAESVSILIENSSSANLTDYQINFTLTPETFNYSASTIDGRDLRVVDPTTNDTLPLWIEKWNPGGTSVIWTKVPSIPGNSIKQLILYYGDTTLLPISDGHNVFLFFEDFENGINPSKWTINAPYGGNATVVYDPDRESHVLKLTLTNHLAWAQFYASLGIPVSTDLLIGYKIKWRGGTDGGVAISDTLGNNDIQWEPISSVVLWTRYGCFGGCNDILITKKAFTPIWSYHNMGITNWQRILFWKYNYEFGSTFDDTSMHGIEEELNNDGTFKYIIIGGKKDLDACPGDGEWYYDDIFIAKFVNPEPIVTVGGSVPSNNELTLVQSNGMLNEIEVEAVLTNTDTVGGIEGNILLDTSLLSVDSIKVSPQLGFAISYSTLQSDSIRFLMYSTTGQLITPSSNVLFKVYMTILDSSFDSSYLDLSNVKLVGSDASYLAVNYSGTWVKKLHAEKGDLNRDGIKDIADVVRIINIALGRPPAPTSYELWAGDMDNDGTVDVADAVILVNEILNNNILYSYNTLSANVVLSGDTLILSNPTPIQGIQFEIEGLPQDIRLSPRTQNLQIFSYREDNSTRIILIGMNGETITPGEGPILFLNRDMELRNLKLVSPSGRKIEFPSVTDSKSFELSIAPVISDKEIRVELIVPSKARVDVYAYDAVGRRISTLMERTLEKGTHFITVSPDIFPASGVYFISAHFGETRIVKKIVVKK